MEISVCESIIVERLMYELTEVVARLVVPERIKIYRLLPKCPCSFLQPAFMPEKAVQDPLANFPGLNLHGLAHSQQQHTEPGPDWLVWYGAYSGNATYPEKEARMHRIPAIGEVGPF